MVKTGTMGNRDPNGRITANPLLLTPPANAWSENPTPCLAPTSTEEGILQSVVPGFLIFSFLTFSFITLRC